MKRNGFKKGSTQEKGKKGLLKISNFFPFMAFRENGWFSFPFYIETGKQVER